MFTTDTRKAHCPIRIHYTEVADDRGLVAQAVRS